MHIPQVRGSIPRLTAAPPVRAYWGSSAASGAALDSHLPARCLLAAAADLVGGATHWSPRSTKTDHPYPFLVDARKGQIYRRDERAGTLIAFLSRVSTRDASASRAHSVMRGLAFVNALQSLENQVAGCYCSCMVGRQSPRRNGGCPQSHHR